MPRKTPDRNAQRTRRVGRQEKKGRFVPLWLVGAGLLALTIVVVVVVLLPKSTTFTSTEENFLLDQIKTYNELADILATVKDADSARLAAPRVRGNAVRIGEIHKRLPRLSSSSQDAQRMASAVKRYQDQIEATRERWHAERGNATTKSRNEPTLQQALQEVEDISSYLFD